MLLKKRRRFFENMIIRNEGKNKKILVKLFHFLLSYLQITLRKDSCWQMRVQSSIRS